MSPRTGRPKANNPLTVEVKARIDIETNKKLIKYCQDNNKTRTDVVREGIKLIVEKNNDNVARPSTNVTVICQTLQRIC